MIGCWPGSLHWRCRLPMPNETPQALRFTWLFAALLVEAVTLAACVGEPFQIGNGSVGGTGGGPPPVPVTWPDSPTARCSDGTTVLQVCPEPSAPFFGQDGNYAIAIPAYTEADGAVKDSVTGLTWEKVAENGMFTLVGAQ